ncbi:MAG: hypothetical protein QF511_02825 [Rhodospirillales bacterium]|jgi:hypothetical protein|nr:hypothetical protein [Rhodospirillales bacterium]HIJ42708.1 hypothetical protein [Rhodospirillaceae bacterium]MDP7097447.1 hypothetical protein [Rhodospirillales bacterium]MDP7215249.1 hypothetical protein [Rhodospirillales bacterium]HIJ44752.1 hypothetical protein [Rhodospirillaceae bacterium]
MKNNLETPGATPKDQADGADLEAAEVEIDTAEPGESRETQPPMGDFDRLAYQFGVGGHGLNIAKYIFVLFGVLVGVAGLVVLGVVLNIFIIP